MGAGSPYHWRELRGHFYKIYVSENAFQAILKPIFPYSITSILSKVRHSNASCCLFVFVLFRAPTASAVARAPPFPGSGTAILCTRRLQPTVTRDDCAVRVQVMLVFINSALIGVFTVRLVIYTCSGTTFTELPDFLMSAL